MPLRKHTTLTNEDITLLAIASGGGRGLTPVQLQKALFLVGQSGLPDLPKDFYPFFPYNYGPFHPQVYADADALTARGLVVQVPILGKSWSEYRATPPGLDYTKKKQKEASKRFVEYLNAVAAWVRSVSFEQLLRAIYKSYPEFREKSVFQG